MRKTPQVVLYVETKNTAVIERLSRLTGLAPEMRESKPLSEFLRKGCDEHCPNPHVHVRHAVTDSDVELTMPTMGRWSITGASIVIIAQNVLPYLCPANQEAFTEIASTIKSVTNINGQGSGAVVTAIRRLGFLGWTLPEEYQSVLEN